MDLRKLLAALIVAATVAFAIGVALERSSREAHAPGIEEGHAEESGGEGHEEGEATASEGELAGSNEGTIFGIDPESMPVVIVAVVSSLVLAGLIWFRLGQGWIPVVAVIAMLVFSLFDVREAIHQFEESNEGIGVVAFVVAALHAAAAALAVLLFRRSRRRPATATG